MKRLHDLVILCAALSFTGGLALLHNGCADDDSDDPANGDADGDTDSDTDGDTDSDTDGDTDSDTDGDTDSDTDGDTDSDTDGDVDTDVFVDQTIGADCICVDDEQDTDPAKVACAQAGVPKPNGSGIEGCDDVPTWTGAELVCLRSYPGPLGPATYFADGYCALQATACTGSPTICASAAWGDYAGLTTCPADTVYLEFDTEVEIFGGTATVSNKICVRSCTQSADCRPGLIDPIHDDEASEYDCITDSVGGAQFCYDPRNLPDPGNYTAVPY